MTPEATLRMAARQAWQGWRNGEFGVLLAALFVAVLALAGVGSIAQRTTDALAEQSRRLVGGDASALYAALDGAPDLAVWSHPVTGAGRVELLPFLREQAVSITNHRFGNPTTISDGLI